MSILAMNYNNDKWVENITTTTTTNTIIIIITMINLTMTAEQTNNHEHTAKQRDKSTTKKNIITKANIKWQYFRCTHTHILTCIRTYVRMYIYI